MKVLVPATLFDRRFAPRPAAFRWWLAALVLFSSAPAVVAADEPPEGETPSPQFRRVLVREEQVPEMARGYLPIKREEFSRLLTAERGGPAAGLRPQLAQTEFWARWDQGRFVGGVGVLRVEQPVEQAAEQAAWLSLEPCDLPLREARWLRPAAPSVPARLGTSPAGVGVIMSGSAELSCLWSWSGQTDSAGETRFAGRWPRCPLRRIWLDLPTEMVLEATHGLAQPDAQRPPTASRPGTPPSEFAVPALPGPNWRRWLIQPTDDELTVIVRPRERRGTPEQAAAWREELSYEVTPQGIELRANLRLDIAGESLRRLSLELPSQLQIGGLRIGDTPLSWTSRLQPESAFQDVDIELPDLRGTDRVIHLNALAELPDERPWVLPSVRCRDLFWQEGKAQVTVYEPLAPGHLRVRGGHQTRVGTLAAPAPATFLQVQFHAPDATLELLADAPRNHFSALVGTTINIDEATMTARSLATCTVRAGRPIRWDAVLPRGWIVDAVEMLPDTRLEDFELLPADDPDHQLLAIRLNNPLPRDRTVQLVVRAHRPRPADGARLRHDQFRLLELRDDEVTRYDARYVIAVNVDSESRVRWIGDQGLTWFGAEQLSAAEAAVVEPRYGAAVFVDDESAQGLEAEFAGVPPSYTAQIEVTARGVPGSLLESYQIVCEPRAASVSRLLVLFSQARPDLLNWSVEEEGAEGLTARRLPIEELQAVTRAAGEGWEIQFRTPRRERFTLRSERTTAWKQPTRLALATLPEADRQTGSVRLETRGARLSIEAHGMESIPVADADPQTGSLAVAAYRYDPADMRELSVAPTEDNPNIAAAWAWSCRLDSQFSRSGEELHEVTYLIENSGAEQCHIRLPAEARRVQALVDGRERWRGPAESSDGNWQAIGLSSGSRFSTLVVRFTVSRPAWRFSQPIRPFLPELSIPVLSGTWRFWLPAGYATSDDPATASNVAVLSSVRPQPNAWSQLFELLRSSPDARRTDDPWKPRWPARWESLTQGLVAQDTASQQRAEQALYAWSRTAARRRPQGDLPTWGQIWREFEQAAAEMTPSQTVLMDEVGLARRGIEPEQQLPFEFATFPTKDGSSALLVEPGREASWADEVLARLGVRLWCSGDVIVVGVDSPREPTSSANRRWKSVVVGAETPWTDADSSHASTVDLVPVSRWLTTSVRPTLPWPADLPTVPLHEASDVPRQTPLLLAQRQDLLAVDTRVVTVLGWIVLLVVAGSLSSVGRRFPSSLAAAPPVAAAIALPLPALAAPLGSGLFLGTALAILLHFADGSRAKLRRRLASAVPRETRQAAVVVLVLAAMSLPTAWRWSTAWGDEPAKNSPKSLYRVLFPIDEEGRPSGDYVHVPREFYHELRQRARGREAAIPPWIWRAAHYELELESVVEESAWDVPLLTIRWQLEVLLPGQTITVPVGRDDATLLRQQLTRDGRRIEVAWQPTDDGWQCVLDEAGTFDVELKFRPVVARQSGAITSTASAPIARLPATGRTDRWGIAISVPRIQHATVTVHAPPTSPELHFPTRCGAIERRPGNMETNVDLGPADLLAVEWERGVSGRQAVVDQLTWLQIRPGAVSLETRLAYHSTNGPLPKKTRLAVDPRLRMLPQVADQPVARLMTADPEDPWVEWEWGSEISGTATISLSFLWSGASGIGQLRVPRLEPLGVRVERHWLAVTTSPTLETTSMTTTALTPLEPTAFAESWGAVDALPTAVFRLPTSPGVWNLATRHREPRIEGQQSLDLSVATDHVEMTLRAELNPSDGQVFEYELEAPAGATVREVQVTENDVNVVQAWTIHEGRVHLLLTRPVAATHRLLVAGSVALPKQDAAPLPTLRLIGLTGGTRRVQVFRQPSALVELAGLPASARETTSASLGWSEQGRLMAMWDEPASIDTGAKTITVTARPNVIRSRGRMMTALRRRRDGYQTIAVGNVEVQQGQVDTLRWEVPADWPIPTAYQPAGEWISQRVPGRDRQRLQLRTEQPLTGSFRFVIMGPNLPLGDERNSVADVRLLDVDVAERYLWLPTGDADRHLDWETSGLQATTMFDVRRFLRSVRDEPGSAEGLPADWEPGADEPMTTYRVIGPRFRATVRDIEVPTGEPSVLLADHHVTIDSDGRLWGISLLDVETAQRADGQLKLPANCQLIHVSVDGRSASLESEEDGVWRVPWGTGVWPRRVEVLYVRIPVNGSAPPPSLPHAELSGIPVRQTLWTVAWPQDGALDIDAPRDSQIDPWRQSLSRLRGRTLGLETAADRLFHRSPWEVEAWMVPWGRRWCAASAALQQTALRTDAAPRRDELEEIAALTTRQIDAVRRLGAAEAWQMAQQQSKTASDADQIWNASSSRHHRYRHLDFAGASTMPKTRAAGPLPASSTRGWVTVALLITALVAHQLVSRGLLDDWTVRWPHAVGVLAGVAWWIWLPLGIGGLLVAALLLLDATRSPWRLFRRV